MKRYTILLLAIGTVAAAIVTATFITLNKKAKAASASVVKPPSSKVDKPGTIDGAKNPEMIPDTLAYTLLFDLLSNRHTEVEKGRAKAYIRQAGIEGADVDA
ncbi:MAG: hypothetical protein ABR577_08855, partial [Pyrinomonadaceae bacterium]